MALPSGTRVGVYEVLGLLGVGGMGEVYRARDTTLKRDVALKVIPDAFAKDDERMARFVREAQMLAALNHVNIAAIYGVEHTDSHRALVLELVDGETLAEVISRGPMPARDALPIALQIAAALEEAHERNIIHRDLKPANVKINSQGVVKVLDFGLARALEDPLTAGNPSESPTMTIGGTRAGMILGTAGYMAPEQARGKPVDRRADIWAFGVVLFEMLSGQQAFGGETISDSLAKVLEREPDWSRLPAGTPEALRKLLERCLKKNMRDRLQAIGDARTTMQEVLADPVPKTTERPAGRPGWKALLPWAAAPIFVAAGWLLKPAPAPPHSPAARFEVPLPAGQSLVHRYRHAVEISPDGTRIVFVGQADAETTGGESSRLLYSKYLNQWEATPIPGTEGAANPVFSPDGQSVAYVLNPNVLDQTEIKKVSLSGGAPVPLATVRDTMGLTWGRDGTIVFGANKGGLKVIRDDGGEPQAFTEIDQAKQEVGHRLPHFLPDGSAVIFTVLRYKDTTPNWTQAQIWAKSLKTGERKLLLENGLDGRYAGNGRLVFARMGKLLAVPFDPVSLSLTGTPVQVLDGVVHSLYASSSPLTSGAAQFSVSDDGALVYAPGSVEPREHSEVVWVTRTGVATPIGMKPLARLSVRLSPDGTRILYNEYSINADLWTYDLVRGGDTRHTTEGQNAFGVWSPDGSRIAFRSDRAGPGAIYVKSFSSPDVVALTSGPLDSPGSWTAVNQELAFVRGEPQQGLSDIYVVSADQPNSEKPWLASRFNESDPAFSPDGRWLAYCSDESGRREVYVRPYPGPGDAVLISTEGGCEPAWSHGGDEIFYRNAQSMMSVRITMSGAGLTPARPIELFSGPYASTSNSRGYDVAKDGRFLMRRRLADGVAERNRRLFPSKLRVILNWTAEFPK